MENLFSDRKYFVKFNHVQSNVNDINSGIFQGGISSPLLFNLYVNDLNSVIINSNLYQFADDSVIVKNVYNENDKLLLQSDLNNVSEWCNCNSLKLNASKSVHMRVTLKAINELNQYTINNEIINTESIHKHLGIIIDNKLTFNSHVNYLCNKSLQKWAIIKRICNSVNGKILVNLYKTYILPLIEYGNSLIFTKTQIVLIEKVQRKITRNICYSLGYNDMSYYNRLQLLKLLPLEVRYKIKILKVIFKIKINKPHHLMHINNNYVFKDTRNGTVIDKPICRINFCKKNFIIYSIDLFNSLPKQIRNETKFSKFIQLCQEYFFKLCIN